MEKRKKPSWNNQENYLCQFTSKSNKKRLWDLKKRTGKSIKILYEEIIKFSKYKDYDDMIAKCVGKVSIKYYWNTLVEKFIQDKIK